MFPHLTILAMLPALMFSEVIGNVTFCEKDPSTDFEKFLKVVEEFFRGRDDVQAKYNCAIVGMHPDEFDAAKSQSQNIFLKDDAQKTTEKKIEAILLNIRRGSSKKEGLEWGCMEKKKESKFTCSFRKGDLQKPVPIQNPLSMNPLQQSWSIPR